MAGHFDAIVDHVVAARRRAAGGAPTLVGVSGAVGVGKSTLAAALRDALEHDGVATAIVCTDGFLLPNAELQARDLLSRKGFPETFDTGLLEVALDAVRAGRWPVRVPQYSHLVYDRIDGAEIVIGESEVILVEGVNALQAPVVACIDLGIYLEAPEPQLMAWFTERFLALCREADADPTGGSFYCEFLDRSERDRQRIAERVWVEVNGVNLRNHIGPSRADAHLVVEKSSDHTIRGVTARP